MDIIDFYAFQKRNLRFQYFILFSEFQMPF